MHTMSGKRWAFVLSVLIVWTNAAHAEAQESRENNGTMKQDVFAANILGIGIKPFATVGQDLSAPASIPEPALSPEDQILERWKEKQLEQWSFLPKGKFEINASAYTASADECGNSDGITASGLQVEANRTIACPPSYPFGVRLAIDGLGTFRCEDRGGAIKGNHFDIYMRTKSDAFAFGRRTLIAEVILD